MGWRVTVAYVDRILTHAKSHDRRASADNQVISTYVETFNSGWIKWEGKSSQKPEVQ